MKRLSLLSLIAITALSVSFSYAAQEAEAISSEAIVWRQVGKIGLWAKVRITYQPATPVSLSYPVYNPISNVLHKKTVGEDGEEIYTPTCVYHYDHNFDVIYADIEE